MSNTDLGCICSRDWYWLKHAQAHRSVLKAVKSKEWASAVPAA